MHRFLPLVSVALALACTPAVAQEAGAGAPALQYSAVQASDQGPLSSADARVEAVRETQLAAQVAGSVVALPVQVGARVRAGQELLRIDARLASQGAAASQAQAAAAQAQLALAAKEYERQQQLFAQRYISQAALDTAQAQWRAASAQLQAQQAQAGAAGTQAALHSVRAPYDGIVASVPVQLGDMALPGRALLALFDPAQLRISAQLTQAQAAQLQAAAQVQLELAGVRQDIASAQVQLLPTADPLSHTVTVRVPLPAQASALPGSFARLWWHSGPTGGAVEAQRLWVPLGAVLRRAEMTGVYVRGRNGQPQLRQVRLGRVQGAQIEVLSGLRVGEQVAQDPARAARLR